MKHLRMYWAAFVLMCAPLVVAGPVEFYVGPDGDDSAPGSADHPFATLQRARDVFRKLPPGEARSVVVAAGTYRLASELLLDTNDSGILNSPVIWRAAEGAEVRLTCGAALSAEMFKPVTDVGVLARLVAAAQKHIVVATLDRILPGRVEKLADRVRGPIPLPELYFNDAPMSLARWPNDGWAEIVRVIDPGTEASTDETPARGGIFEYAGPQSDRWKVDNGVWLQGFWRYDWDEELIRVADIDREKKQITLASPALFGLRPGNPSPRRFRAINLLEELDAPGEFYIDREANLLYFWPPAPLEKARVELATGNAPALRFDEANNIIFRGFTIENSLGDGIVVQGGENVRIEACDIRNMRQVGIRVVGGKSHCVTACDIHETGSGGLVLEGGDRKTLTPAGHEAVNNHIWHFSQQQLTYAPAVRLVGVGQRAANNLIHDAPHMAVGIEGNDHVFEYNVVRNVCTETDDAGALYKGRNPSCRGNMIRHNLWQDIGSPNGHGTAAIYFDDGDGGDTVFGNIFLRCGQPGAGPFGAVFSHGGYDLTVDNNIFIDCKRALGSAPWSDEVWKKAMTGAPGYEGWNWREKLLVDVNITLPPYSTRYPELAGFMELSPGKVRISRARQNLIVRCGQASNGNWQCDGKENLSTDEDPGFVDAAHGDYALSNDANALRLLPSFKPIPINKIGLFVDPLRQSLPPRP